jgi:hypothetical protein
MASRDPDSATLADQLRLTRLSLARLLLHPGRDADSNRQKVEQLTEAREDFEKRIASKLHLATLRLATTTTTPIQLRTALPADAAFVDLYRYTYFEQDPMVKGKKGEKRTDRYVAFIVRKDKPAIRAELKEAKPIDDAWAAWHKVITADRLDEKAERDAAKRFTELVWEPIRPHLPDKVKTVYLAPDGKLAQVPYGSLPGKKADTVLLDEHAVCHVPHGPWLTRSSRRPSGPAAFPSQHSPRRPKRPFADCRTKRLLEMKGLSDAPPFASTQLGDRPLAHDRYSCSIALHPRPRRSGC